MYGKINGGTSLMLKTALVISSKYKLRLVVFCTHLILFSLRRYVERKAALKYGPFIVSHRIILWKVHCGWWICISLCMCMSRVFVIAYDNAHYIRTLKRKIVLNLSISD